LTLPQDVIAAKAEGRLSSVATLKPRPEFAASNEDIAEITRRIDHSPANRSLSAIEPVSAPPKGKLKNGDQRPAAKTRPARTEIRKITDQRLGSARVTRGNVGDSP